MVLGNVGDASDDRVVAAVRVALEDGRALVRAHAVWAARRLGLDGELVLVAADASPEVMTELNRPAVAPAEAPNRPSTA